MTWWQKLLAWLGVSNPGPLPRRETVEDWIEANGPKIASFANRQNVRRSDKMRYFQRLRGWARPSDNDDDPINDLDSLPAWVDLGVDVWEAPVDGGTEHGYTLNIFVTDTDTKVWVLRIDSKEGSLGWTEVI
jgi:hypothetical protein